MSKADEALADVRRWLCDNLGDGDAGKVCGMLSVVSRRIAEIDEENAALRTQLADVTESMGRVEERCAKLRELTKDMFACISHANEADWFYFERDKTGCGMSCTVNGEGCGLLVLADRMRELGIEVDGWLS